MIARIALSLALMSGFAGTATAQTLMGDVSYPRDAQLTRTAVLEVTLEDVSDASAAVVIGRTRIPRPGQGPVLFTVAYDSGHVVPAKRYAVRAHIVDGTTTLFESARPVRVLTQGTGSFASITLVPPQPRATAEPTTREARPADTAPTPEPKPEPSPKPAPAPKPAPEPKPIPTPKPAPEPKPTPTPTPKPAAAPKVTPAPKATPTPTPKPVAAPKPVDAPKSVETPKATPEPKPAAPPAPKPAPASAPAPTPAPAPSRDAAPLAFAGAEWTMTEINNKPVRPASKTHRKIFLVFDEDRGTFSGTSGCNDLEGRFETAGGKLTLKSDRSLKICRVDQKTERSVRGLINDTRGYRISGTTLDLLNDRGQRIARLQGQQVR